MLKVIAGFDDGLDYRQPEGLQTPESYTDQVTYFCIHRMKYSFLISFLAHRNFTTTSVHVRSFVEIEME